MTTAAIIAVISPAMFEVRSLTIGPFAMWLNFPIAFTATKVAALIHAQRLLDRHGLNFTANQNIGVDRTSSQKATPSRLSFRD